MKRVSIIIVFLLVVLLSFAAIPNTLMGVSLGQKKSEVISYFERNDVRWSEINDELIGGIYIPSVSLFNHEFNRLHVYFTDGKVVELHLSSVFDKDADWSKHLGTIWAAMVKEVKLPMDEEYSKEYDAAVGCFTSWMMTDKVTGSHIGVIVLENKKGIQVVLIK